MTEPIFNVALLEPEIPPNTGNIMRLCANTGARLHLIRPLGFVLDEKRLRRAGLDYRQWIDVQEHDSLAALRASLSGKRLLALSTRGRSTYSEVDYQMGDILLFGPETRGLPQSVLDDLPAAQQLRLPMTAPSRSLNLSNTVAVVLYEGWRQLGFTQATNVDS